MSAQKDQKRTEEQLSSLEGRLRDEYRVGRYQAEAGRGGITSKPKRSARSMRGRYLREAEDERRKEPVETAAKWRDKWPPTRGRDRQKDPFGAGARTGRVDPRNVRAARSIARRAQGADAQAPRGARPRPRVKRGENAARLARRRALVDAVQMAQTAQAAL